MYVISPYTIIEVCNEYYLLSHTVGAKIPTDTLAHIVITLDTQEKREITEQALTDMARRFSVDIQSLKETLITKLRILKPLLSRKIPLIYVNSDDALVDKLLCDTLTTQYHVHGCPNEFLEFQAPCLVIYYRQNYSDPDFIRVSQALKDNVYLVTCGVIHHTLVIDNIYFNHSGLPTHDSNYHHVMRDDHAEGNVCKPDGLSFYRELLKGQTGVFPQLSLSPCQRGYVAYSINQFLARFLAFDGPPTPHDAIHWRWHVDLLRFGVHKEVAIGETPSDPILRRDTA